MSNKLSCNPAPKSASSVAFLLLGVCLATMPAFAGQAQAPDWLHALASLPVPTHSEKDDVVLMYSEEHVTVDSVDKMHTTERYAYRILRPDGRVFGLASVNFNKDRKVVRLHGWCIPAQGADFEVKDKDAIEVAPGVSGGELINDVHYKVIHIPAADPGNLIGWESEVEEKPLALQDLWFVQHTHPVRESHYKLTLPANWEYKTTWVNGPEVKPTASGNEYEWTVRDLASVPEEYEMPPWRSVATHMIVSFLPTGEHSAKAFSDWHQMGLWYADLVQDRIQPSPEMQAKVAALTANSLSQLAKMQAIGRYVQTDVRYVAIELGIGGWQPHAASEVFRNHYGDCKDKATLTRAMLHEIGIDSYHVPIFTARGAVTPKVQAHLGVFNHAILAVRLPVGMDDPSLQAVVNDPKLGRILFFDPTNTYVPFGQIPEYLQANYGLFAGPDGGQLIELPRAPASTNGIRRSAILSLDAQGTLKGSFEEVRVGYRAAEQRQLLDTATKQADRTKPVEQVLAHSLTAYELVSLSSINVEDISVPFGYRYGVVAPSYAKYAGDLLLVRPRVIGTRTSGLLEDREPRKQPVVFDGPEQDIDSFDITIPAGFKVDDLPSATDADYPFASYHSKTTVEGNVLKYKRTFEVKELKVEMNQMNDLKKLYRTIANDERSTAVLKRDPAANASVK